MRKLRGNGERVFISSFSVHFLSISSFSLHFLILSPFPLNFLIFSPFPHSLSISSFSLHFLILSPFPHFLSISSSFPHSLSISSQPGCKAATVPAALGGGYPLSVKKFCEDAVGRVSPHPNGIFLWLSFFYVSKKKKLVAHSLN